MIEITYALCRHYFDKGIPDEPWYKSPGSKWQSIEYFPEFKEEHWMRKYWFNYFADVFYLKMSALWDSVYEIINVYYQYNLEPKIGFKQSVTEKVKNDSPSLYRLLDEIHNNQLYKDGKKYRIAAAHGTSIGEIKDTVKESRNTETVIPKMINEKVVMEKVNASNRGNVFCTKKRRRCHALLKIVFNRLHCNFATKRLFLFMDIQIKH